MAKTFQVKHRDSTILVPITVHTNWLERRFSCSQGTVLGVRLSDNTEVDTSEPIESPARLLLVGQTTVLLTADQVVPQSQCKGNHTVYDPDDNFRTFSHAHSSGDKIGKPNNQSQLTAPGQWIPSEGKPIPGSWLQIDLPFKAQVHGVVTAGRGDVHMPGTVQGAARVTEFQVCYSEDGIEWNWVSDCGLPKKFVGNISDVNAVHVLFPTPVSAISVKIYPIAWVAYVCLRAGLLVCKQ